MTKRAALLCEARIAGYHNDAASFTRLCCTAGVGRAALNHHWYIGQQQKHAGVPCGCYQCRTAEKETPNAPA